MSYLNFYTELEAEVERIRALPVPNVEDEFKPDIYYSPGISAWKGQIRLDGTFSCEQLRAIVRLMVVNGGDYEEDHEDAD